MNHRVLRSIAGSTFPEMEMALGRRSEPTASGMAAFHRRKRDVYRLLREVDRGSRAAMRGLDVARPAEDAG